MDDKISIDSSVVVNKPSDDDLRKVASWIRFHSKEYKLIVRKCLELLDEGNVSIDFEILVVRLITMHKVSIKYDLILPLKHHIESEFPELDNRLIFGKKAELNIGKGQLMMLISQLLF